jgi:uncharacterized membrane protein
MTRSTVKHYCITLFVFLVLDAIWLGLIAQRGRDEGGGPPSSLPA